MCNILVKQLGSYVSNERNKKNMFLRKARSGGVDQRMCKRRSRARRGRRRAIIKRADAKDIQIKGPQTEEKGDNEENGRGGYTDQGPAEGGEG